MTQGNDSLIERAASEGWRARIELKPTSANPYGDTAMGVAWHNGYMDSKADEEAYYNEYY